MVTCRHVRRLHRAGSQRLSAKLGQSDPVEERCRHGNHAFLLVVKKQKRGDRACHLTVSAKVADAVNKFEAFLRQVVHRQLNVNAHSEQ